MRSMAKQHETTLNWDDLRFIATVARTGSLLAASGALGVDHTTVGRRVSAAERALGTTLFVRSPTGLALTPEGEQLLVSVAGVEAAILAVERQAGARDRSLAGRVKITAPETLGCTFLAPRLLRFSAQHPGLVIDVDASGAVRSLHRREAEVAVRTWKSDADSLFVKKAGRIAHSVYAATSLASRRSVKSASDLQTVPQIVGGGEDKETHFLRALAPDAPVVMRCDLSLGVQAALHTGHAVGVLPRYLGDADAGLVRVPVKGEPVDDVFLTVHKDLRQAPRVRAVLDFLGEAFASLG
jgi:DNA-binding transcriptional LysR family regulator